MVETLDTMVFPLTLDSIVNGLWVGAMAIWFAVLAMRVGFHLVWVVLYSSKRAI
jgi:uncharacterized membrane-anchored protein YjiN (DUF445 family)